MNWVSWFLLGLCIAQSGFIFLLIKMWQKPEVINQYIDKLKNVTRGRGNVSDLDVDMSQDNKRAEKEAAKAKRKQEKEERKENGKGFLKGILSRKK